MKAATQIVFVTGKGGVGKTTVGAALGQRAAQLGKRTLAIETAADGNLSGLFDRPKSEREVTRLRPKLDVVRVDARSLIEDYFRSVLRFSFLSDRLLGSSTFNALTAAAPGISEFLLLEKIHSIAEPGLGHRRRYDLIIVDGPATGHARKLLRTPQNLLSMVPGGPLSKTAARLRAMIEDHRRTSVVVVSLAEEMAVAETIELCDSLENELALHVARPVVNRVFPKRFTRDDAEQIEKLATPANTPVVAAARFAIARRREGERHISHLRRALGVSPVLFRQLFAHHIDCSDLEPLGRTIGRAVLA